MLDFRAAYSGFVRFIKRQFAKKRKEAATTIFFRNIRPTPMPVNQRKARKRARQ